MAEPEKQSLFKMHVPQILAKGGGGFVAGYGADLLEEKVIKPMVATSPLAPYLSAPIAQLGNMDGVDALTYALAAVGILAPAVLGRKDLTLTGAGFGAGKYYRQYGASAYNLPRPF